MHAHARRDGMSVTWTAGGKRMDAWDHAERHKAIDRNA